MKKVTSLKSDLNIYFLVYRCQVGDELAFKQLYEQFYSRSLRLLRGLLKFEEAEDLNQEVWLTVYKQIAGLDDAARFRTWLFQITRNKALDHFRKAKRFNEFHEILRNEEEPIIDADLEIEQNTGKELEHYLGKLSPKLREPLMLHVFEGMDYEEMALILGVSIGTVKSRIHNAKRKIKRLKNEQD